MIRPEGRDFIGRDALLARMANESRWEMVLLSIETDDVDMAVSSLYFWVPNRPAGLISRTMAMITKITVFDASG